MPFSYKHQITVEKTPTYFRNKDVPIRIYKMNPKMKLILIIRNPVIRAISHYTHFLRSNRIKLNSTDPASYKPSQILQNILFDENFNFKINLTDISTRNFLANIIIDSMYVTHLRVWYEHFPREQIFIVNGEQLIKNPLNELNKIEKFLGLKSFFYENDFEFDVKKGFFCINKRVINRCLNSEKGRVHPKIDEIILKKLYQFFKPLDDELFKLIKKDPFW
jgi:[heparan sulfate]-glucosamine 3-sulfotransferase 5